MDSSSLRFATTPRSERVAARLLIVAFILAGVGISIAGGGAANVGRYLMGELAYFVGGLSGKHPLGGRGGDPTLPGYFIVLTFTALFLLLHAIARSFGKEGWLGGPRLWRWALLHAVVSTLWLLCVNWPQVFLVGIGLVHPAWSLALAGFGLEFLIAVVVLSQKRSS